MREVDMAEVSARDRALLEKFFNDIYEALGWIVEHIDELVPPMNSTEGHRQALEMAWQEWTTDGGTVSDRLADVRRSISETDVQDLLIEHGLTGDQLAFKLGIFDERLKSFWRVAAEVPGASRIWTRLGGLFRRAQKRDLDISSTAMEGH
jgi:hypothetical protein